MADDLGSAAGMIAGKAVEGNLLDKINQMENRIAALEGANTVMADVGEITDDLGDVRAGRILALTTGYEPTDSDATGVVIDAAGVDIGGDTYNLVGINNGVLQFGLSSTTGKAMFGGGAVIADIDGLTSTGLRTGLAQLATAGGATRFGVLEMFVPQGGTTPAFGMSLSDNDDPTANVVVNGGFETGDLTGWTQTGTSFSAEADESGGYHLACAEITGADEEIVSDRIAVTAASKLAVSVKTKDVLTDTSATLQAVADTYIAKSSATTNYGSEASLLADMDSTTTKKILVKFDYSSLPTAVYNKPNFNAVLRLFEIGRAHV